MIRESQIFYYPMSLLYIFLTILFGRLNLFKNLLIFVKLSIVIYFRKIYLTFSSVRDLETILKIIRKEKKE